MDSTIKGLYKREWKMMRGFFVGQFIILTILMIFILFDGDTVVFNNLIELMSYGFVILPLSLLYSLNKDVNQLQLFTCNPQFIHKILGVKYLNCSLLVISFLFILIGGIMGYGVITDSVSLKALVIFICLTIISLWILVLSTFLAVIVLFLWTLHQLLKRHIGSFISSVLILFLFILFFTINEAIPGESFLYENIVKWGEFQIPTMEKYPFMSIFDIQPSYIGVYVFHGLIAICLYLLSTYLLNRKIIKY